MNDNWTCIVGPSPRDEAETALAAWFETQRHRGNEQAKDEVREDVILSKDHATLVRFMVKRGSDA